MSLSKFNNVSVSSSLYWSSYLPMVAVRAKQNPQIRTVRHTSASERETGLMTFDIVTARGTEIAIENTRPITNMSNTVFFEICYTKTGKF